MASPSTRSLRSFYRRSWRPTRLRIVRIPVALVVALLRFYQVVVSPLLGPSCRFAPSCSRYAEQAVSRHGILIGGRLAFARIVRCHPWNDGGYDPVPGKREA